MRVLLALIGGLIGFLLGGGFHALGTGHLGGLALGAFIGFVDGWIIELETREKGIQFGRQLGWFNGALLGAMAVTAAGGGLFHAIFAVVAWGWVGSQVAGLVIPGLIGFWAALDQ